MKRWLAAAGGGVVASLVVIACAEHAPQTPTPVAQSGGSGDENGHVRAQETPNPPVFPSAGPTPQTYPSTGPTPQTFPSTGPTPQTFPSTGPTPQTFPSTGPTPQTYPSTASPQPTPVPTPTALPSGGPTPSPSATPAIVTAITVATGRRYEVCSPNFTGEGCPEIYIDDPWIKSTGDAALILMTANADTSATNDPLLSFTVTRAARIEVFFNYTNFPDDGTPTVFCTGTFPLWAADGTGWVHGGSSNDILLQGTERRRRFSDRARSVPANTRVTLGPNMIPGCPAGFTPLMYWVRILPGATRSERNPDSN